VIYVDSSALVKLALAEPETAALTDYLTTRADQALVSSSLHRAEVLRAIWRAEPGALPRAQRMIRRVSLVSLSHDLLDNAATLPPGGLSTTAAITCLALVIKRDLTAFLCYDKQLSDAAEAAGLHVASPASRGRLPEIMAFATVGRLRRLRCGSGERTAPPRESVETADVPHEYPGRATDW